MLTCAQCGGPAVDLGNGTCRCNYCGYTFEREVPAAMQPQAVASEEKSGERGADVFEENINGILEIRWSDAQYLHSGSGFLVKDGYAVTNTHVVTREDGSSVGNVSVKVCGETVNAGVVRLGDNKHGSGTGDDLALIRLDRVPFGSKTLKFENFGNVRIGERVFVVGNSLGYGTCITSGIVSDKERMVDGHALLMTDCAVNGGNSGGPIFNEKGKVIGAIVSGIDRAEGMNFAIPSKTVISFLSRCGIKVDD